MSVTSHVNASGSASITGVSIPDHTPPDGPVYVNITIEYNVPAGEIIWPGIWDNQNDVLQERIALRVDGSGRETITADFKPPTEEGTYVYTSFVEDGTGWTRIDGPTFTVVVSANGSAGTVEGDSSGGSDAPDVMWEKQFGFKYMDGGSSVQVTSDGGYIITGVKQGTMNDDVYLVKTDSDGNLMWEKAFGGESGDQGKSVQVTDDGGYIITGYTYSSGAGVADVYLLKTDSDGTLMWEKTFGGTASDFGWSVQVTSDGGYIITGYTESFGAGETDVYLVKTDSEGNLVWEKTYGGSKDDYGYSVQVTSDGGYIITGHTTSSGAGGYDVYLIKTDSNGNLIWEKTLGGIGADWSYSVQVTSDDGYIIAGETYSLGASYSDYYLIKTDPNGNIEWNKTYGRENQDRGQSVQVTSDGGYILTGYSRSWGDNGTDIYLVKTDSSGNMEWNKTIGGIRDDFGYSVQVTSDGGYILAGKTASQTGSYSNYWSRVYLVKIDSDGAVISQPETYSASLVSVDAPNEVYVGDAFTVELTVSYEFTVPTEIRPRIYDVDAGTWIAEESETLVGAGTKTYSFDLTTPIEEGTWALEASVWYISEGELVHDDVDWVESFDVNIIKRQENTYTASIVDLVAPSEVSAGEMFTVEITVSYEFTVPTEMSSKIFDTGTEMWIIENSDTLVGTGTKTYSFELTAPTEEGTWALEASVWYISEGELVHNDVDWAESFDIHVIGDDETPLWEKTFGGSGWDSGYSVQVTGDGDYIITGYTDSSLAGGNDVYLLKTDSDGNLIWRKVFGGTAHESGSSVQITSDGGYIITGKTSSYGAGGNDVYLLKTDSDGNLMWEKVFGGTGDDRGESVQVTGDGGYIVAGFTSSFGAGGGEVYLVKTDSDGNLMWEKVFGGTDHDRGYSVQITGDGGYIITGQTSSSGAGGNDVYLVKTDSDGNLMWEKTFGGTGSEGGSSVQITGDGGYIITGSQSSDVYLVKTDSDGNLEWEKTFGGTASDHGSSIQITKDGGYIITGWTDSSGAGGADVYLLKTDSDGNLEWEKTFGGTASDFGWSVQVTSDGGYIITGWTDSFGVGVRGVYLVKVDSQGIEEETYAAGISDLSYPSEVEIDEEVTVMVSVDYEFPGVVKLIVDVDDGTGTLDSVSEELVGDGSADYTLNFNAPSEPGEYIYTVTVTYLADDIADRSDDGVQEFTITVLPSDEPNITWYYAGITDLDYPSEVDPSERVSVTVSVDYEFPGGLTLFVDIDDETDTLDSVSEELVGDGSADYTLNFNAPSEPGEYSYTVIVSYVAGDIADTSEDGVEEFIVNVVSSGGSGVSDIIEQIGIPGFQPLAMLLGLATVMLMLNTKPRKHQ